MEITTTPFKGILLVKPDVFLDDRGYFYESFNKKKFLDINLEVNFLQDNVSKSRKGTIRGLHYQMGNKAQGKLCQVLYGRVLDVSLDLRVDSPTFGKHFSIELSEDNHLLVWIPVGFAHGFSVLSDEVIFKYKCTNYYCKENERTILFNDPELNIDWKVDNPVFSQKDLMGKSFEDSKNDFFFE
ncbi:MAG: dTDP-4-dehydrorhamnose 3,5-epimerase [Ignavibacteriaceae bacterium]|nr:dTDP-4-dehydrorhamnose 3,5-epimerase [Ignavibacteriaceae bacterium]